MAFNCGFYNAIEHDRVYSATQFGEMFDGLITDGIYATIGEAFAVKPGTTGLSVLVGTGRAWFNKTWSVNTTTYPLNLTVSDLLLPRIDAVVLEVDTRVSIRNNSLKVITGTPNVNPVAPTLTRDNGLYQYPLAYVNVAANQETIKKSDIDNRAGRSPTPFVTGIIQSISIDSAWTQWEGQFEDWFAGLKASLSGDVAVNLQNQIQQLKDGKVAISSKATTTEAKAATDDTRWMTPLKVKQFFDNKHASDSDIDNESSSSWISPNQIPRLSSSFGSIFGWKKVEITSSTTWSRPSDMRSGTKAIVICVGGGGGGGGSVLLTKNNSYSTGAGGGGGGGYITAKLIDMYADSYSIQIGEGGSGGAKSENTTSDGTIRAGNGKAGGDTIFGSDLADTSPYYLKANGGKGGYGGSVSSSITNGGGGGAGVAGGGGGGSRGVLTNEAGTGGNGLHGIGSPVSNESTWCGGGGGGAVGNGAYIINNISFNNGSYTFDFGIGAERANGYPLDILIFEAHLYLLMNGIKLNGINSMYELNSVGGGGGIDYNRYTTSGASNGGSANRNNFIPGGGAGGGGAYGKGGNSGDPNSAGYASGGGGGGSWGKGGKGGGGSTSSSGAGSSGVDGGGGGGGGVSYYSSGPILGNGGDGGKGRVIVIYIPCK